MNFQDFERKNLFQSINSFHIDPEIVVLVHVSLIKRMYVLKFTVFPFTCSYFKKAKVINANTLSQLHKHVFDINLVQRVRIKLIRIIYFSQFGIYIISHF